MPLYRDGKITLTENSRSVTGQGTEFGTETMPGDVLILSEGEWVSHCFEIKSIESDTELTIDVPSPKTANNVEYVILRSVSTANNMYLMRKIDEFLEDRQVSLVEFRDWMNGEVDGGPEGDGRYPLTDRFGVTVLVPCPNWLVTEYQESFDTLEDTIGALGDVSQAVADSQASAQSASQSASDADASAQASAQSASNAASSAQSSSQSASSAQSSQQAAETSASNALASEQAALGHAQDAAQYAQEAEESALEHLFEDGEVSQSRGWTSQRIVTEIRDFRSTLESLKGYISFHQDFGHNDEPLDPRITFSRSGTATYIKNGRLLTAGVDEPVFEDGGLRLWGDVTNLYPRNNRLVNDSSTGSGMDVSSVASIFEGKEAALYTTNGVRANPFSYNGRTSLDTTKRYTHSIVVEVITDEDIRVTLRGGKGNDSFNVIWEGAKEALILMDGVEVISNRGPNDGVVMRFSASVEEEADYARFLFYIRAEGDVVGEQVAVHHYQIEEGITVGPMVWTDGSTETMPADNASIKGAAFQQMFNPNEGALVLEFATPVPFGTGVGVFRFQGRSLYVRRHIAVGDAIWFRDIEENLSFVGQVVNPGESTRVGIAWGGGKVAMFQDGVKIGEYSSTTPMSLASSLTLNYGAGEDTRTTIHKHLSLYTARPTDAQMEALTNA